MAAAVGFFNHFNHCRMPSELDPLLPHNDGSPEIIRDGDVKDIASDRYSNENPNGVATSPLRNLLAMFTFAVGFALFIAWLSLGVGRASSPAPKSPAGDVTARVNRILSTNPLIGNVKVPSWNRCSDLST